MNQKWGVVGEQSVTIWADFKPQPCGEESGVTEGAACLPK